MQGIQSSMAVGSFQELIHLWAHENLRIYSDRLVSDDDRRWFSAQLQHLVPTHFRMDFGKVFTMTSKGDKGLPVPAAGEAGEDKDPKAREAAAAAHVALSKLLFCDFMTDGARGEAPYAEVKEMGDVEAVVGRYLDEHNDQSSEPMQLVLFHFAVQHVCRICRVLRQPAGNALLVGVGGSGRQSLTKLATFMSEYDLFQMDGASGSGYGVVEWHDDLKAVLRKAGETDRQVVFLMTDTQMKYDSFVEDISCIFNTGVCVSEVRASPPSRPASLFASSPCEPLHAAYATL
jgi:dynein heavy chain